METGQSLDDILNGEETLEPVAAAPVAEPVAEPAAEAQPRDDKGRFAPKGETEEAQAAEPAPSASPAPQEPEFNHPATLGERRRRQAAEAERDELKRQLAQFQQQPAQPQAPQVPAVAPDPWDDPQGHAQWTIQQAARQAREEAQAVFDYNRTLQSAHQAAQRHPDYDEKIDVFRTLLEQNPSLEAQMKAQPDPAEWAYQTGAQHSKLAQYGSLDAMLEAEKKVWEAEALEKLKANLTPATVPPTLSNERNVGSRSGPEWSGPTPLSDILR